MIRSTMRKRNYFAQYLNQNARQGHVDFMATSVGEKLTSKVEAERTEAWSDLENLAIIFLRYLRHSCKIK